MRKIWYFLIIALLQICHVYGQSVVISPTSGRLIAGLGQNNEVGFASGWKSLWWHNQLPLKLITSDEPGFTSDGLPRTHGCNMTVWQSDIIVSSLSTNGNCYIFATLPDGYRFTGYELVVQNNIENNTTINGQKQVRKNQEEWYLYETNNDYDTSKAYEKVSLGKTSSNNEYTLKRNSMDATDMGSNLYFVFHGNADNKQTNGVNPLAMIRIKKFVVYFSAEGSFDASVQPTEDDADLRAVRRVPYPTGKIALGDIRQRMQQGSTLKHYAYEYHEVEELDADMLVYNEKAVLADGSLPDEETQEPNEAKTLTQEVENFGTADVHHSFGAKNGTYYIESPIEVVTTHGNHDPIGYRITDAKIHYYYGEPQDAVNETFTHNKDMFTISAELNIDNNQSNGKSTYYLHPSGRFVRKQSGETTTKLWQIDDKGRIYHYQDGEYTYLEWYKGDKNGNANPSGNNYYIQVYTSDKSPSEVYQYSTDNRYYRSRTKQNNWSPYQYNYCNTFSIETRPNTIRFGESTNSYHYVTPSWDSNLAAFKLAQGTTASVPAVWKTAQITRHVQQPAYIPKPWTLTVYDKDGSTVVQTVNVSETDNEGTVEIHGLNNDAVKFMISDLPDDADSNSYRALFNAEVTMQSLDPYINSLDIVCENQLPEDQITDDRLKRISQPFVASDFTVHGGAFHFYVPANWTDEIMPCTFSFQNLRNRHLDNTYYDKTGTGHARNSIVGSEYYGLNAEKTNVEERNIYSASEPEASGDAVDYTKKISTLLCGTQPFYFTNTAELDNDDDMNNIRTLHQYQFSVEAYGKQGEYKHDDVGYDNGEFHKLTMADNKSEHAYLFVCDEPRYNIAPTKKIEHRLYSYYDMEITLITKDFEPVLEWTKIYDPVNYDGTGVSEQSQWGLKLSTTSQEDNLGVLPISMIKSKIQEQIDNTEIDTPNVLEQVLYVDASNLSAIIYATNTGGDDDLDKFKKQLSPNALFYLPNEFAHPGNNYAYKDNSGEFHAVGNIVLNDRKPFFAPYDVTVAAENKITYTRGITASGYNKTKYGTLLLPYNLMVDDNGIHTDAEGQGSFRLFTMNTTKCLSIDKEDLQSGAKGYFSSLQTQNIIGQTTANTPYLFEVIDDTNQDNATLVASQYGATLLATSMKNEDGSTVQDLFYGETSTGKISDTEYTLRHTGSYKGCSIPKAEGVFYLAQGKFLNSLSLNEGIPALNSLPFRSWYTCETSDGTKPSLADFIISFDENEDELEPTDILFALAQSGIYVRGGNGTITIISDNNREIKVRNTSGQLVASLNLAAGELQTIAVQRGLYIVNNLKVAVK